RKKPAEQAKGMRTTHPFFVSCTLNPNVFGNEEMNYLSPRSMRAIGLLLFACLLFQSRVSLAQNDYDRLEELSEKLAYYSSFNHDSARILFPVVYRMGVQLNDGKVVADALLDRSFYESLNGRYDSAQVYALWGLRTFKNLKSPALIGEAYIALSTLYLDMHWRMVGKSYADSASIIAEVIGDEDLQVRALSAKANVLIDADLFMDAQPILQRAIDISKFHSDYGMRGLLYSSLALCYHEQGRVDSAISNYFKSIELYEKGNDRINQAIAYSNLANLYIGEGDTKQARDFMEKTLTIYSDAGFPAGMADVMVLRGSIEQKDGNYYLADSLFRAAHQQYAELGEIDYAINARIMLADLYKQINRPDSAEAMLMDAYLNAERLHHPQEVISSAMSLGRLYIVQERFTEALQYLEIAAKENDKFPHQERRADISRSLATVYEKLGRPDLALENFKRYMALTDSLNTMGRTLAMAEMQERFNSERTKAENLELLQKGREDQQRLERSRLQFLIAVAVGGAILIFVVVFILKNRQIRRQKNEIQKAKEQLERQQAELQELNQMKDRLFSIISHDLRSPLNNLHDFITIMEEGDLSPGELNILLKQLKERYQHVSSLVDNLLNWARLQVSDTIVKPRELKLYHAVNETLNLLEPLAEAKDIDLVNYVSEDHVVVADENAVQLLLRNFVSNAIKYSKPDSQIEVRSHVQGAEVVTSIRDYGVGIPADKLDHIFDSFGSSTRGTQNEKGTGVGLSICREYAEKNHGKVWVESEVGEGSTFFFSLPMVRSAIPTMEMAGR
ncbi:MAG: tetratricopeptide repeat-containing sensor histidine kinase, partial [Bacteroidota bacterium]|nr:tetratricopeptide repeat-containing sensor histidine kinase [Bacteroidota bacterium]